MKIALGTAQFGLNYGVTNNSGKVSAQEASKILNYASEQGICTLDTAPAYGDSETVLGNISALSKFDVITKIPSLKANQCSISQIVTNSMHILKRPFLDAVLFHDADDLLNSHASHSFAQAVSLKEQGKIAKIGVSVYSPEQLFRICEQFPIEIVQVPFNCFDQRFSAANCLALYDKLNIEVHARSIFLQGALLADFETLPEHFRSFSAEFARFSSVCQQLNCAPISLALAIIYKFDFINRAVIGVCAQSQLSDILNHHNEALELANSNVIDFEMLKCHNLALINPATWPIKA